ncbi:efflux RND transporter permease subunit [Oceanidesulfovibrio marinus]|uniref:Efflux RND transporter permease subunit n=1 Tax=Oceanidesulfovibrio marinus TaxID=370038 RepID=A0ABX6NKQ5_9BACT|nr:efflux RND transporter permease subunit [Oceanidesulfovibrio marinus]QJT10796.1 efflux RND transporter permease subunit [Oceanidesulfovibrio marinus]
MTRLASFSVGRPVFTTMATLIVVILGAVSLSRLPIDLMPDITYPTLSIRTEYENAGSQEVETLITEPIEQAIAAVPGVEEISSASMEGQSDVRVSFVWGTDLDAAANDLRDRLDRVIPNLPEDADRPMLRKFDLASAPVLILAASSKLDPVQMQDILENQVRYRIERVPGVAALNIWGGLDREIHVGLVPERLKALDIPLDTIITRIKASNLNLPAGVLETPTLELSIRTPGEYANLDELAATVIAVRRGAVVRLRDIAEIEDSWERVTRLVRVNGEPGVRLSVNKQSGTNTVEVVSRVLEELENINRDIPQIRLRSIIDTSTYIKNSIANVSNSLLYGGIFAVLVLLFFLRNVRSTLVVAAAIPISIIATFMLIYFGGFTLNIMTLGGLALGVGMLVDNAIVVLENIYRLREEGMSRKAAAIQGASEVSGAIVASTLTTLVVFLPMIFIRGMAGIMFKQLAYVVSFSLLCSLGVALTLVPMLASSVVAHAGPAGAAHWNILKRASAAIGRLLAGLESSYKSLLHGCLRHRGLTVALAMLLLAGSIALIPLIGSEMMPRADEGEVRIYVEMEVGTKLDRLDEAVQPIEAIVRKKVPEAQNVITLLGSSGWRNLGSHAGQIRISLKPQKERNRTSHEIADGLRAKLAGIPGVTTRVRSRQELFVMRMVSTEGSDSLEVLVRGYDLETADALAQEVKRAMLKVRGVTDADIERESGAPERLIHVDRSKAESMGVDVSQVANVLQTSLSGTQAGNFREGGDEYAILVKLKDAEHISLDSVLDLTVTNDQGQPVVLRNLVSVEPDTGPVRIDRKDQERIITLDGDISGVDLGTVIRDLRKELEEVPVPQGFSLDISGDYEEQQKAFRELGLTFVLALVLVYMVMACLYESLRDPFVVMFSVPLAIIGVSLMLFLTHTTFNMQSYIGCIMLGGILVNNAILLVDQTNQLRKDEGMAISLAIEEAGRRRLRPILMTAMTTIFGLLPLALGIGEGGEAQAPMARAVIGGLASSTLITLVVVPVMYSFIARKDRATPAAGEDAVEDGSGEIGHRE